MKAILTTFILSLLSQFLSGQNIFQKTIDFIPGLYVWGMGVAQTNDGGFIISGTAEDTLFNGTYKKVCLIKTTATGDTSWTKTYEDTLYDQNESRVIQTTDGGYILAVERINRNACFIKTDALGDTLWTRSFRGNGSAIVQSVALQQTTDSGYIACGYYSATGTSNGADGLLIKMDATGTMVWAKAYGGNWMERFTEVRQTTDGGYIAVGTTYSFGVVYDIYLVKTDSSGNVLWTKSIGGNNQDWGTSVKQTADGGYIVAGYGNATGTNCDVYLVKTNSTGDTLWTKTYGGSGVDQHLAQYVEQTSDQGYIIAGQNSFNAIGSGYLIKTNAVGDSLWTKSIGTYGLFREVHQTIDGGYIAVGTRFTFQGGNDAFLVKIDSSGNSCAVTANSTVISSYTTNVSDPATMVATPLLNDGYAPCVIESGGQETLLCSGVNTHTNELEQAIAIYPNPFSDVLFIKFQTSNNCKMVFTIRNILGQTMLHEQDKINTDTYVTSVNLIDLPKGIYFIELLLGDKRYLKKLVKS